MIKMNKNIFWFFILLFIEIKAVITNGDGTYYGRDGAGEKGICMLPRNFNNVKLTVAVAPDLFQNGQSCGKCLKIWGEGNGLGTTPLLGPYFATIDNLCPKCKSGDIDFGLEGNGRWLIHWDFISCQEARNHNLRGLLIK
jgi:hypothetical protein